MTSNFYYKEDRILSLTNFYSKFHPNEVKRQEGADQLPTIMIVKIVVKRSEQQK